MRPLLSLLLLTIATTSACWMDPGEGSDDGNAGSAEITPGAAGTSGALDPAAAEDPGGLACRARVAEITAAPRASGAPAFEAARIDLLGKARGEPLWLVREPAATADEQLTEAGRTSRRTFERSPPGFRVSQLKARHRADPATLRALLLREGYAFTTEAVDAFEMAAYVSLTDLFSEPEIWLQRGHDTRRLQRETRKREVAYRYVDGPLAGRAADLLFGDRIATSLDALADPAHRDLQSLANEIGFDRGKILHQTERAMVMELRFGDRWVQAVVEADGAALRLGCIAAEAPVREAVEAWRAAEAPRLRAMSRLREVVTEQVQESLRFDRPQGEKTADRDGELRPQWLSAYLSGRSSFQVEDTPYPVFDGEGKASPPQVCMDFVLDTFERSAGTWYRPRGQTLGRQPGRLDFNETGIVNRRAVLAFVDFAEKQPEIFETRRFRDEERIPFQHRSRFFTFLVDHADEVRAGDVVAIHGLKRDNRVHQHAILVERTDPLTGFPYGLADQMKRPRRRSWEGIMAEAPARSLLYRVRPLPSVFARLDPGPANL